MFDAIAIILRQLFITGKNNWNKKAVFPPSLSHKFDVPSWALKKLLANTLQKDRYSCGLEISFCNPDKEKNQLSGIAVANHWH